MKALPPAAGGFHGNIEELRGRKDPAAMQAVAKELEALFAYEMIKAMRETSDMSKGGFGKDTYMSLFDMELAKVFADKGLGLKELLFKGLNKQDFKGDESKVANDEVKGILDTGVRSRKQEGVIQEPQARRHETSTTSKERDIPAAAPLNPRLDPQSTIPASDEPQIPVDGHISSKFGMRKHPVHGNHRFHHGLDIAAPEGTDVYPYRAGTVLFSGEQPGYGNTVIIDHGDGHISKYAHNRVNRVKAGDKVGEHTVIAEVGSTGVSTGPHLHFEVRQNGKPIDPAMLLAMK
jgi:murein DD-endopeptidase MepM/ murein hydrolase activator NlpD